MSFKHKCKDGNLNSTEREDCSYIITCTECGAEIDKRKIQKARQIIHEYDNKEIFMEEKKADEANHNPQPLQYKEPQVPKKEDRDLSAKWPRVLNH